MARSKKDAGPLRLAEVFAAFSMVEQVPLDVVHGAIDAAGRRSRRICVLPAAVTLYLVLLMALYGELAAEDVLVRTLSVLDPAGKLKRVRKQTIAEARKRLGAEPLEGVYDRLAVPAGPRSGRYRSMAVYALDGSCLDLPDSASNSEAFGRAGCSRGRTAFPQLRLTALVEQGSNLLLGAQAGAYRTSEHTLALKTLDKLPEGALVIMDRGLFSAAILTKVQERKAHMLCRVKRSLVLPVQKRLPDGSYLSLTYRTLADRRSGKDPLPLRVVEYEMEGSDETYRLVTTLLDPRKAPAAELASLYAERWNIEEAFRDFKTRLRGSWDTLRSKTPDGVRQELWALLTVYNTVRSCMLKASRLGSHEPKRLSFTKALRILKNVVPNTLPGST